MRLYDYLAKNHIELQNSELGVLGSKQFTFTLRDFADTPTGKKGVRKCLTDR